MLRVAFCVAVIYLEDFDHRIHDIFLKTALHHDILLDGHEWCEDLTVVPETPQGPFRKGNGVTFSDIDTEIADNLPTHLQIHR